MTKTPPSTQDSEPPAPPQAGFEWDDSISYGDTRVDEDHHRLAHLIERLQLMESRQPDRQLAHAVFNDLMEFAMTHFSHEEDLLRKSGYPHAFEHALAHERVLGAMIEFTSTLMDQPAQGLPATCRQLRELVCHHHSTEDGAAADWMARYPGGSR